MNDRDDRDLLGTSDEANLPKRENPYLKKKREKAERASKREATPADVSADPFVYDSTPAPVVTPGESLPDETDKPSRGRLSNFFFEHVKLITAILTVCVVISLVLITDVVGIIRNASEKQEQESREKVSLLYVEGLSLKSSPITWSDLGIYRRETMDAKDSVTWVLPVEGTHYEVWISGVAVNKAPAYVYLFDMKTGDHMDLNEDNFAAFIDAHP